MEEATNVAEIKKLICRFCPKCSESISVMYSVKYTVRHCSKCKTYLNYKCLQCNKEYKTYGSVFNHIKTKCRCVTRYSCSFCDFTTTNIRSLRRHINRLHTSGTAVSCERCRKQFKNIYTLKYHLQNCGKEQNLSCNLCDFKTHHKHSWRKHLKRHSSIELTMSSHEDTFDTNNEWTSGFEPLNTGFPSVNSFQPTIHYPQISTDTNTTLYPDMLRLPSQEVNI